MISLERLSKRYGRTVALDGVSLTCEPGTVTALLGPDGSGRSTALRVLLGLSRASDGRATIGGATYRELRNPGRVVGSSLDPASLPPGRTGRETLLLAAIATGVPTSRVGDVLERVGLDHAGRRLVGRYSFAMRQRLGIARALVGDPHVLVLDESASALDADGLAWLHGLLREFADVGGTVLLTGHRPDEVHGTADHLVVLDRGRVVRSGSADELLRPAGVVARGLDREELVAALTTAELPVRLRADGRVVVAGTVEQVGRAAAAAGQVLLELREDDVPLDLAEPAAELSAAGVAA